MDTAADRWAALSPTDQINLTGWKRVYKLMAGEYGARFTRQEAAHLAFMRLLCENGAYLDDCAPAPPLHREIAE